MKAKARTQTEAARLKRWADYLHSLRVGGEAVGFQKAMEVGSDAR
jgi:hypothetical protein